MGEIHRRTGIYPRSIWGKIQDYSRAGGKIEAEQMPFLASRYIRQCQMILRGKSIHSGCPNSLPIKLR